MEKLTQAYSKVESQNYTEAVHMEEKSHEVFLAALPKNSSTSKKLLDLGCGDAYLFDKIKAKGYTKITGLDASAEMLSIAKKNNPDCVFIEKSLPSLVGIAGSSFDILTSMYAIQNITPNKMPYFYQECFRVLKPGGKMIIITKSPMQQWLKKLSDQGDKADYFKTEPITISIFNGAVTVTEPSHTYQDYFSFTKAGLRLEHMSEHSEFPASLKVSGEDYPTFMLYTLTKK